MLNVCPFEESTKKSTKAKEESQCEHEFVIQSNDNTHFLRASSYEKAVERGMFVAGKDGKGQHKETLIEALN